MAGASESFHEPMEKLSPKTLDMHRALVSLQEELEAVDWYQQRADACEDDELRGILLHNMNEEIEHACMVIEWLRRHSDGFAKELDAYLYTDKPILQAEDAQGGAGQGGGDAGEGNSPNTFTIGTLKK